VSKNCWVRCILRLRYSLYELILYFMDVLFLVVKLHLVIEYGHPIDD
jgi:hypothetical protein